MPRGGHAQGGRRASPTSLRANLTDWTVLPAEGRDGDPPPFPLLDPSPREVELWALLWRKPQAIEWHRLGLELEVGLYVRNLSAAELPGALAATGTLVRQYADSLGLSAAGMRAHRWVIARPVDEARPAPITPARSARERMYVVRDLGDDEATE
ncbi:hypothetical protein AB0N38_04275 [Micromonospora aurantiaca]|uniref:hypothetical protein n=1 Tax=Micromonospora aurantiaca (nom. illeg.) TaxID=47850 RepID=UPI00342C5BEE